MQVLRHEKEGRGLSQVRRQGARKEAAPVWQAGENGAQLRLSKLIPGAAFGPVNSLMEPALSATLPLSETAADFSVVGRQIKNRNIDDIIQLDGL
jgi:hypothetical protein